MGANQKKDKGNDFELLTQFFTNNNTNKSKELSKDKSKENSPQDWCEPDGWTSCHPTCYPSVCHPSDSCYPHKGHSAETDASSAQPEYNEVPAECMPNCFPQPCAPDIHCFPTSNCIPKAQMKEDKHHESTPTVDSDKHKGKSFKP